MNNLIRTMIEEGSEITNQDLCLCDNKNEHTGTCRWKPPDSWGDLDYCSGPVQMFRYQNTIPPIGGPGSIPDSIFHVHLCSRHRISFASRDYIRPVYDDDENWPTEPPPIEAL